MTLLKLRFYLGVIALVAVVILALVVVCMKDDFSALKSTILMALIAILGNEVKASSAWAFDGVPVEPETKTKTVSETVPQSSAAAEKGTTPPTP